MGSKERTKEIEEAAKPKAKPAPAVSPLSPAPAKPIAKPALKSVK